MELQTFRALLLLLILQSAAAERPAGGLSAGSGEGELLSAGNVCFDGLFTADRCCRGSGDVVGCWALDVSFERCCDEESRRLAEQVRRHGEALHGLSPGEGLRRCLLDGQIFKLTDYGSQGVPNLEEELDLTETAGSVARRLLYRLGHTVRPGRCLPGLAKQGGEKALALYEQLRRGGAELTGWVVNLGAGSWSDPMYALAGKQNLSGVFVDPLGPLTGQRRVLPGRVRFVAAAAEPVGLCEVLQRGGLPCAEVEASPGSGHATIAGSRVHVDFLKVDVDGCDCALTGAALRVLRPKVVWMEINLSIPPPLRFARQCHPDWRRLWHRWMYGGRTLVSHGCSLAAAVAELQRWGYSFYGLVDAADAIFVDEAVAELMGGADVDEVACYREKFGSTTISFLPWQWIREWMSLPPDEALGRAWCNLSLHDYFFGVAHVPFALSV